MLQKSPKLTKKLQVPNLNQKISIWEDVVSMQEHLNKLVLDLRSLFEASEYSEIKLLLFNKTLDNWVLFKNTKAELDASDHLGQPKYKFIKAVSMLESTKSYIKYLESIRTRQ